MKPVNFSWTYLKGKINELETKQYQLKILEVCTEA